MKLFQKPSHAIAWTKEQLINLGQPVKTEKWQSIESPDLMFEALNVSFQFIMPQGQDVLAEEVRPNMPWAEDHFQERVAGLPLNPGEQYKNWPFYVYNPTNDKFRDGNGQFSHTYMERIWPSTELRGIRYNYGDMRAVIGLLAREPYTRQAFLPIWFPEDTGALAGERVPCTIGYLFMRRGNYLHMTYYIRSCDYMRHFRDDIYLAVRKNQWIIEQLKALDPKHWSDVVPGIYTMHIMSLHVFNSQKALLSQSKM